MTRRHAPPPTRYPSTGPAAQAKPARPLRSEGQVPPPTRYPAASPAAQAKPAQPLRSKGQAPPPTRYQPAGAAVQAKPAAVQRYGGHDEHRSRQDREDLFQPWNAANPTAADFEGLRAGGAIALAALMNQIPVTADDEWVVMPDRTTRGFKFTWNDGANDWEVWGHEPDLGAAAGHAGAAGWVVRIKCGNRFLMNQQVVPPVGGAYDWAPATTQDRVRRSHITLTGVP